MHNSTLQLQASRGGLLTVGTLGGLWLHHESKRCFVAVYFSAKVSYWYVKRLSNAAKNHANITKKWGGPPSGIILWVSCDINVWRRIRCLQRSNLLLGKMARINPFTSFQKNVSCWVIWCTPFHKDWRWPSSLIFILEIRATRSTSPEVFFCFCMWSPQCENDYLTFSTW